MLARSKSVSKVSTSMNGKYKFRICPVVSIIEPFTSKGIARSCRLTKNNSFNCIKCKLLSSLFLCANSSAFVKPTICAKFSVPARRLVSCSPPS